MIGLVNICTFSGRVRAATTYPYDGVHLWGGDLLGPLYGCQDLLLVLEMGGGRRGEAGGKDKRRKVRKTIKARQKHGRESWGGWRG